MPSPEVVLKVRDALASLQRADLKDPRLVEVLNLSEQLVDAMNSFFGSMDRNVYGELRYIAAYIARTRGEISALRPNEIRENRIPQAGAELDAVVKNTEDATHTIMSAAEAVMSKDPGEPDFAAFVNDRMLEIFEACSFQDITGQRVRKVVDTLRHIEERVARFAHVMGAQDAQAELTPEERRKKALLLNGPSLNGPEVKQDAIDALFTKSGPPSSGQAPSSQAPSSQASSSQASSSQGDIDALFA
jgi:chemotaxis protein CheZ